MQSCKKKDNNIEVNKTLFHTYVYPNDQIAFYLFPLLNNNNLIISTTDDKLTLLKVNQNFNNHSDTTIIDLSLKKETIFFSNPQITVLQNNDLLISSKKWNGNLMKINANGNIVFKNTYNYVTNFINQNSYAIEGSKGNYYISRSNGNNNYRAIIATSASKNIINQFNTIGNLISKDSTTFNDSTFAGKILMLNIYKVVEPNTYYFYGLIYPYPFTLTSNPHLFISKIELSNNKIITNKTTILDPNNTENYNLYSNNNTQLFELNNSLIISSQQRTFSNFEFGKILKVDENHKLLWEQSLKIGSSGTYPNYISKCTDGGYLISGYCTNIGLSINQPFACKLNSSGTIIWKKIFLFTMTSKFGYGMETSDGGYLFSGATTSFGNGDNSGDIFIMKTDKNGKY